VSCVLNGRAPAGDEQGECTRGLACLDYAITDACTYSSVEFFRVCLPAAEVSDHLALECILPLSNDAPASPASASICHVKPVVPRFDPAKREQFVVALRGGSAWGTVTSISSGLQDGSLDPIVAGGQLSKLIHEVALRILGEATHGPKPQLPSGGPANKWFKHCREEHKRLRQALQREGSHAAAQYLKEFRRVQRNGSATMTRLRKSICLMT
jgi:hypothetical protein